MIDGVQNDKVAGWSTDERSVVLAVQRQPGTNTVEVVDAVRALMPSFRDQLPASVNLKALYDRSETVRASVNDVQRTLLVTVVLVVLVIFLFLRNLSATVIPSLALPLSIIGTFSVMYELGYSLDNLSLMAITLSVGFVVDDAIVMLENIVRHMEMGKGALEAAIEGSREIGFTILSMTLSLAAVFIPVLFMGGIVGRLLREFAVTIAAAILVSGFVSLSLTPMLCSRFLRPPQSEHHGPLYQLSERWFDGMLAAYRKSLGYAMRHRRGTLMVSLLILVLTIWLFEIIPKGFLPSEDTGQLVMFTKAEQGISYDAMVQHQKALMEVVMRDPNVGEFFSSVGSGGPGGAANTGILFMHLVPRSRRRLSADQVANELRPKVSSIPGLMVFIQNPPTISIGAQFTRGLYQVTLQSPNTAELYRYAPDFEMQMRRLADVRDVDSDLQITNPQVSIDINRDRAHVLGVSAQSIEDALDDAYGSRQISTIYAPNDEFRVILELEPEYQDDPATLRLLYIRSSSGKLVPLDTVARLVPTVGPLAVSHTGQLPSVTISFNVTPGVSLARAFDEVRKLAANAMPATVTTTFQGTAAAFESSLRGLGLLLLMAILVIYLVLGILYESFIHPVTILSGLPSAGFGALVTLMLFRIPLDLFGFVGVIMLIGLVKKNAIMMIDFALDAQRTENKSAAEAIFEGCIIRFRPIMMTTMAALMGTLPIAIGLGAGAESRRPLGVAVVGGLFFSQFLTLYITPVVYTYLDSVQRWVGSRRAVTLAAMPEAAAIGLAELPDEERPRRRAAS